MLTWRCGALVARRDKGRPRGKPIEAAILEATLAELDAHGLEGASIARIADTAEVNKTTVYRKWPTKELLVAAALEAALHEGAGEIQDTGSLRGDLRAMLDWIAERAASPGGRALLRASMSGQADAAVRAMSTNPEVRQQKAAIDLVLRSAKRGEWNLGRHLPDAVFAMLSGSVLQRVLLERLPMTEEWKETVVDVLTRGLASGAGSD